MRGSSLRRIVVVTAVCGIAVFSGAIEAGAQIAATTENGRKVLLRSDGTWTYESEPEPARGSESDLPLEMSVVEQLNRPFYCMWAVELKNKSPHILSMNFVAIVFRSREGEVMGRNIRNYPQIPAGGRAVKNFGFPREQDPEICNTVAILEVKGELDCMLGGERVDCASRIHPAGEMLKIGR